MPEYVYLIRNQDLYNIGVTESLPNAKQILAPGVLEASLKTNDAKAILKILQNNYSDKRLPQSNYFRLTKSQFIECKQRLENGAKRDDFKPFFNGPKLILAFISAWVMISLSIIRLGIQPIFNQFN